MDDKKNYHNDGQEDAAEGRPANPPYRSTIDTIGALSGLTPGSTVREQDEANREYDGGYRHGRNQR